MRLLIYIHSLASGGAERVVVNLANHWIRKGWDVTVVTVATGSADFYEIDPAVKRIMLGLDGGTDRFLSVVRRNARRIMALRRILRENRPHVTLSMMTNANVVLALAASGMPEVCTIGSEHIFPRQAPLGHFLETMRRHTYGRLDAVVALTEECASWIRENTPAQRVPVIPNAACWPLPSQEPRLSPLAAHAPQRKLLLAVGRLAKEKNFRALVEAFAAMAPRHPEWDLAILGEGPEREALVGRIRQSGLESRIFLPGRLGNVGEWYEHADLYAMSSLFEGFPNTLVEALAYGVPAVSFDCDTGPRDIIRHGIDGYLVAPGDAAAFADSLERLMGDERLRAMLAGRAVEARERFSVKKIATMWEALFGECMADRLRCKPTPALEINKRLE
jgi:glycosyltransferase involved in cell wall biosynthesis